MTSGAVDLNEVEILLTGEGLIGWEVVNCFDSSEKSYPTLCFLMKREIIQK